MSSVHPVAMAPKETLSRLSQNPPASPLEQVPWVLGLIYEGVRVHRLVLGVIYMGVRVQRWLLGVIYGSEGAEVGTGGDLWE